MQTLLFSNTFIHAHTYTFKRSHSHSLLTHTHIRLENADYFLLATILYYASVSWYSSDEGSILVLALHSFSTAVCAIIARFIISKRTMNELHSRSFDDRIVAVVIVVVTVFVVFGDGGWGGWNGGFSILFKLYQHNGKWMSVCDQTQMWFIEISSEMLSLTVRLRWLKVTFAYKNCDVQVFQSN